MMTSSTAKGFIAQLKNTPLLEPVQQQELDQLGQSIPGVKELATELVKRGWITAFQANQVNRGKAAELVLGSCHVLQPLGKNANCQVFKAYHRVWKRHLAVKTIRPEHRDDRDSLERFREEVRRVSMLCHSGIAQVFEAGGVGDVWYVSMELLEG